MRERLRERRQRRDESEYEAHAAMGMVMLAEQRLNARESRDKAEATKQRNLVCLCYNIVDSALSVRTDFVLICG